MLNSRLFQLLHFIVAAAMASTAFAGLKLELPGHPPTVKIAGPRFEGVWSFESTVLLVKQFDGVLFLQGNDPVSVWQGTGVIDGNQATVRGTGFTSKGGHFAYESRLTLKPGTLKESWKVFFPAKQLRKFKLKKDFLSGEIQYREVK